MNSKIKTTDHKTTLLQQNRILLMVQNGSFSFHKQPIDFEYCLTGHVTVPSSHDSSNENCRKLAVRTCYGMIPVIQCTHTSQA